MTRARYIDVNPLLQFLRSNRSLWSSALHANVDSLIIPVRKKILDEAESALNGEWQVFGHAFHIPGGRPEWRRNPLTGAETPLRHFSKMHLTSAVAGGDIKYLWEINRHAELLRLAQAYRLSGDERYAGRAVQLLEDWVEQNPPLLGINWASALEVALRSIAWCWLWELTSASPAWDDNRILKLLWTLHHAATFINRFDSIHHSPNTHLTGEALGLTYVGATFGSLKGASQWLTTGLNTMVAEVPHQFLEDGFHFERSTGYHEYNLEFYLHTTLLLRAHRDPRDREIVGPLTRGLEAVQSMRGFDGSLPIFGDHDGGRCLRLWPNDCPGHSSLLALGSAVLDLPSLMEGLSPQDASICDWFGVAPSPHSPRVFHRARTLHAVGIFIATDSDSVTGATGWQCLVNAGAHRGNRSGHPHTDIGHVEITHGYERIVADPGSVSYAHDEERCRYRSLAAHATVEVNGNPLALPRGTFGWLSTSPTPLVVITDTPALWCCRLSYTLPNERLHHERQVVLVRGVGVFVADWLRGPARTLTWRWPLGVHPERQIDDSLRLGQALMISKANRPFSTRLIHVSRSPSYGVSLPATLVECQLEGSTENFHQLSSFVHYGANKPTLRVKESGSSVLLYLPGAEAMSELSFREGTSPELRRDEAPHAKYTRGAR